MIKTLPDVNKRYKVSHYPGVAFYVRGWPQRWEADEYLVTDDGGEEVYVESSDGEWVDDVGEMVEMVMVGDDRGHLIDLNDISVLDDDEYCSECGQIGCTHDGRN